MSEVCKANIEPFEILTIEELAAWLKCSKKSVYGLTCKRARDGRSPLPVLRLGLTMRFRRSDVEAWLEKKS